MMLQTEDLDNDPLTILTSPPAAFPICAKKAATAPGMPGSDPSPLRYSYHRMASPRASSLDFSK